MLLTNTETHYLCIITNAKTSEKTHKCEWTVISEDIAPHYIFHDVESLKYFNLSKIDAHKLNELLDTIEHCQYIEVDRCKIEAYMEMLRAAVKLRQEEILNA